MLQEIIIKHGNSIAHGREPVVYPCKDYHENKLLLRSARGIPHPGHTDISACVRSVTHLVTAAALKKNSSKCYSAPTSYLSLWSCSSFSSFSLFWVSFLRQQSSWLTVSSSDSKFFDSSAALLLLQTKPDVNNNSWIVLQHSLIPSSGSQSERPPFHTVLETNILSKGLFLKNQDLPTSC